VEKKRRKGCVLVEKIDKIGINGLFFAKIEGKMLA
jgi:hypothetical protein